MDKNFSFHSIIIYRKIKITGKKNIRGIKVLEDVLVGFVKQVCYTKITVSFH